MARDRSERRRKIWELLKNNNEPLSIEYLSKKMKCSRRTIESDINAIRAGNKDKLIVKNDAVMLNANDDKGVVEESSTQLVRQAKILSLLMNANKGKTKKQIVENMYYCLNDNTDEETENTISLDNYRRKIERDLKDLVNSNYLLFEKESKVYNISPKFRQLLLSVDTSNAAIDKILSDTSIGVYSDILYGIAEKLNRLQKDLSRVETKILQKKPVNFEDYEPNLEKLFFVDYKTKQIHIEFKTRRGKEEDVIVSIGAIVFLVDEGNIYLICKNTDGEYPHRIIELSRVISMQNTEIESREYGSAEYKIMCEQMVRVSCDDAVQVKYTIVDVDSPKGIIFMTNTKDIKQTGDREYEVTDVIRGEYDFTKMARDAGNSIIVTSPKSIVKQMKRSANTIVNRYEIEYEKHVQ